jgi:hypothetical protein
VEALELQGQFGDLLALPHAALFLQLQCFSSPSDRVQRALGGL